jgi:arginase
MVLVTFEKIVSLVNVPFDFGTGRKGAYLGPGAIYKAGLLRRLTQIGISYIEEEIIFPPFTDKNNTNLQLKHLEEVVALNNKLADKISNIVEKGNFPLALGGDHSIAIGTLAGLAPHYDNLGVIWFDAHSDLETEETGNSGNLNNMSLAVGLGMGNPQLTQIHSRGPIIKPEHVVIIGARQLAPDEKTYIRESGITCFTMHDIDRLGMAQVIENALSILRGVTDGIHLSFDLDIIDPQEAPGTGSPVKGGISYREANFALELMYESGLITSAEFVELNPLLDIENKTTQLTVELICSLLGKRIL